MRRHSRHVPVLLLLAGLGFSAPACAAQTYGYPNGRPGGYTRDLERRAYDNGYREGLHEGQSDAQRNRDYSYQRHDQYRDADEGFHRNDGDVNLYRRTFRQGFQTGYSESYNRYARNGTYGRDYPRTHGGYSYPNSYPNGGSGVPRGGGYGSPAAQNGYRAGIDAGRSDAGDRHVFDPVRAKRYREGD